MKYLQNILRWIMAVTIFGILDCIVLNLSNIYNPNWLLVIWLYIFHVYFLETVQIKWIRDFIDIKQS